jgi:putative colanic acid biosynthesis UDP-glucose lipid carrier transferase
VNAQLPLSSGESGDRRPRRPDAARRPEPSWNAPPAVRIDARLPAALVLLERIDLAAVILTLFACLLAFHEPLTLDYAAVAVVAVVVCSRCITPPDLRKTLTFGSVPPRAMARLLMEWGYVIGILLLAAFALKISDWYSRRVVLAWFGLTPFALIVGQELQVHAARWLNKRGFLASRYVIVGANKVGNELARRLSPKAFLGYFDFRCRERLADLDIETSLLGHSRDVGEFVRRHGISYVYIALPISNSSRIQELLSDLRNSTASVYFVPDVFAFDLIQARIVDVNGMPALAVCDTPLRGADAVSKRVTDVVLAASGLFALSPVFLAVAIATKLSSRGPVLFKQRRYGLGGDEILVYKFRTMTVCEDGADIRQALEQDARVTAVGRFLRRTSLDELPQLWNVLQGKMSLVGPRPHAVAHNELYRQRISGYMLRHKVRPGLTGWAQVNGLRGETDSVDKMEQRVRYDLDYLNNWSLALDFRILMKTVRVVIRGRNAH